MSRIIEIKNQIQSLDSEVNSLKGKLSLLNQQLEDSIVKRKDLQSLQILNQKSIELLHFVKKVTQDKIKEIFETVITHALQYIHQNNKYKFELEFTRRGSLPELKFLVKTPDMQESHDILDTRGGGSCDIVSLALRFVLLEISKMPGFLFLDEPEKHLDSPETLQKMIEFIKEMQKETKRQIFWITHKQEVVDDFNNPIIISKSIQNSIKSEMFTSINSPQNSEHLNIQSKKRGRPKGVKNASKI